MKDKFRLPLREIQPSQLYISLKKLEGVQQWFHPAVMERFEPVPVKKLCGAIVSTDGHTRLMAAWMAGLSEVPCVWDEDEMDWEAYRRCVEQCRREGILWIGDLKNRLLPAEEYERRWLGWCAALHETLEKERAENCTRN